MQNILTLILEYNEGREPERLAMKYAAMRQSASGFLRGSCHLFHARLPDDKVLYRAPLAWTCGDMHVGNFGSYRGDNGLTYFDINDFDEATLAPCTWPLVRLLSSILVIAPELQIIGSDAVSLAHHALDAYAQALASGRTRWVERDTAEGEIRSLLENLRGRSREAFLDSRTERQGKHRRLLLAPGKALAANERQHEKVRAFIAEFAETQADPRYFKVLDVARRISGLGSLGMDRYVILVRGKGSPDDNALLDLKLAQTSSLTPCLKTPEPRWRSEAERIVSVQSFMQAVPAANLHAVSIGRKSWVLRELQPMQDRIALSETVKDPLRLAGLLQSMAELLAWSQLRSSGRKGSACVDELIEFGEKRKWRTRALEVAQSCATTVNADWHSFCEAYDDLQFAVPFVTTER